MLRPLRVYLLTYIHPGKPPLNILAEGRTPCLARAAGFRKLEARVATEEALQPREGWRLLRVVPVKGSSP